MMNDQGCKKENEKQLEQKKFLIYSNRIFSLLNRNKIYSKKSVDCLWGRNCVDKFKFRENEYSKVVEQYCLESDS